MTVYHGKDGAVYNGANQVGEMTKFSVEESVDLAESSKMGQTAKTRKAGLKDWKATVECMWDKGDTNGQEAMTVGASLTFNFYPEGTDNGKRFGYGDGIVEKVLLEQDIGTLVMRRFEVVCNDVDGLTWAAVS